jgi:hypothetical protein
MQLSTINNRMAQKCFSFALLSSYRLFPTAVNNLEVLKLHIKCPIFLSNFNQVWSFWTYFLKSPQHQIPRKIRPVAAADGGRRTADGGRRMAKQDGFKGAFRCLR